MALSIHVIIMSNYANATCIKCFVYVMAEMPDN